MSENWNLNDPYVYEALAELQGQSLAVQTTDGSVRGVLKHVMPDFIVIEMGGSPFFVRTAQIIWLQQLKNA